MAKFTPGPWMVAPTNERGENDILAPKGSRTESNTVAFRVLPHNAALIAAAPEMYAALREIAQRLECAYQSHANRDRDDIEYALCLARRAWNAARGVERD